MIEEVADEEAGADGDLGERVVGGGPIGGAGAAAVDDGGRERGGAQRGDDGGADAGDGGTRAGLEGALERILPGGVRRGVLHAGDLRLVAHDAVEGERRRGGDGARQLDDGVGIAQRRAAHADVHDGDGAPAHVDVDDDGDARAGGARGGGQRRQLRGVVDDGGGVRVAIGLGERGAVGGLQRRIGEEQIARGGAD